MSEWEFPKVELNEQWFKKYGIAADPARAARQWQEWLRSARSRRDSAKFRKALELAVGVSRAAVDHYLSNNRWVDKLSEDTLHALDTVAEALGNKPQREGQQAVSLSPTRSALPKRGALHIALLANLAQFTSPRFRLDVIHSIIREGARHNFSVALHELPLSEPAMSETIGQIIRNVRPNGIVWFQLTPSEQALEQSLSVPSIVVHGVIRKYSLPVIGHVFPLQDSIPRSVTRWARQLPKPENIRSVKGKKSRGKVAVVHMREERLLKKNDVSIRNQRIKKIFDGLRNADFEPQGIEVNDYSASNAWEVIKRCPNADGYVCLSDEIAIGVKHLLWARGEKAAHRILGFDDSSLAALHNVSSIDQHINDIGRKVCERFESYFHADEIAFKKITLEVNLTLRTEVDPFDTI